MNETPDSNPEWESLLQGFLESSLSRDEEERLSQILGESPEAEEAFVRACELHAMLEAEPEIRAVLGESSLPENVVPLGPSTLPEANSQEGTVEAFPVLAKPSAKSSRTSRKWLGGIAAAIAVGIVGYFLLRDADSSAKPGSSEIVESPSGKGSGQPVDENDPQAQYERAVLANLGSGSQQRPPTNFVVEPSAADEEISYNRDIRPILSDNCFSCHGPDEHGRKADLRLDTREGAVGEESSEESGAIIVGSPEESELIARILTEDADDVMPPPESHKKLTPAQIKLLTRWITEGAEYEDHWAFLPVQNTAPDDLSASPIDFFVDRRLERYGITRSPRATKRTLIRRTTLDLTGLPPTPEEVAKFLADESEDAYETLVDRLLASPAFGEHRARYWLDAARYGDTHGLHLDNYREMWPYRDWVVRAFNENLPFDQFTIEQIAGDLLPQPTQTQLVATGFNRCNVTTSEGGAIDEEFLVRYAVDRVATTSTVWMGLTAGCAQCHDHKFDPFTMKDFYQLYAFFNNTTQPGMDGNTKDSPPSIRVYQSPEQKKKAAQVRNRITAVQKKAAEALANFDPAELTFETVAPTIFDHGRKEEPSNLGNIGAFGRADAFSVAFRYTLPREDGRVVLASRVDPYQNDRGWRVVWEDRGIVVELIESYPGRVLKRGMTRRFRPGASGHFSFNYDGSGVSAGIQLYQNGDPVSSRFVNEWHDTLETDFDVEEASLLVGGTDQGKVLMPTIVEFVLKEGRLTNAEMKAFAELYTVRAAAKKGPEKQNEKEKQQWKNFAAVFAEGPHRAALTELAPLETELSRIEATVPTTLVMAEKGTPPAAHMLIRGEYDQKGDQVAPAFPEFLEGIGSDFPMNRLGLAQWLVHPDHPLTARVTVNRIWQELFGVGLVKTSEDFGTQGENPSHPALLDWLAHDFVESGWDVKNLYRTIVLSETYRQSSKMGEGMAKRDPENRLLARGPRFRLDAEVIRDQALFASGLLNQTMGGPGVKPYQPGGIWEAVGYTNSNTQTFYQDFGPAAEHRRSIYTFWKRTAHPPNLAIFDAPNRESCIMRRERTNTPLQALVMMNDPQFVRASRYLAMRVIEERTERDERLDHMALLLRGRPLEERERQVLVNSLDQFYNIYGSDTEAAIALLEDEVNGAFSLRAERPDAAPELAAWIMVANQMLNLDEVLNKN